MDFQIAKFHKQVLNLAPKRKKKEKKDINSIYQQVRKVITFVLKNRLTRKSLSESKQSWGEKAPSNNMDMFITQGYQFSNQFSILCHIQKE